MSILWEPRYAPTEPSRELEGLSDALGQNLLQTYLEMAYANYIRQSTRNLIGHIYRSSPLLRCQNERNPNAKGTA